MNDLFFYDIECFSHDSLVVFKDIENHEVAHFWSTGYEKFGQNGFEKIADLIHGHTLVGYNNHYYDDKILTAMINGYPQKALKVENDKIINGEQSYIKPSFMSLDCMQEIDVSRPSLKLIEGNMGRSILESSVPFDINRPLTQAEKDEVLEYCRYDVQSTIEVFKLRKHSYFDTKKTLLELDSTLPKTAGNWNTTTISANILTHGEPLKKTNELSIPDDKWRKVKDIPPEVWNMWETACIPEGPALKKFTIIKYGCRIDFGFGGLHGVAVRDKAGTIDKSKFHNVKLLDVGSMYPSIVVLMNGLGNSTALYDQIRLERLAVKKSDPLRANALKLILNSVYGNLKQQYSLLYNPMMSVSVCAYGQMALFDLSRRLYESGYRLINLNTDGVAFKQSGPVSKGWETIQEEWESEWGLYLDLDKFKVWIQKDVNNYVAIKDDDKIKVKGGEVNKYHFEPEKGTHKLFSNNNCRVVHRAIVDKLLFNKDPIETLAECLDKPEMFQYVLKAGRTYKGVCDSDGNFNQKVNRVFAAKETAPHTKLYKVREDGGKVNFPDAPERMYLWNDDVNKIKNFSKIIDLNHYLNLIIKKLEAWGVYS